MKEKKHIYSVAAPDVVSIDCELFCGVVVISGSPDNNLTIERNYHSHIKISRSSGSIKIKQYAKPVFHRAKVEISVPSCCVPDITVKVKQSDVRIKDGRFGDLQIKSDGADVVLTHASFVNADIISNQLKLYCSEVSVKSSLDLSSDEGETLMENCLCAKTDIVCKNGNVGISNLKCYDSAIKVNSGNVSVNLNGSECDYRTEILSRRGTCNRQSTADGKYSLKVYSDSGNIVVDFTDAYKENIYGNDNVAEDSRLARGA